jgi:predicted phosphoribosyltransferase
MSSEIELHMGQLCVVLRDSNIKLEKLKQIAHQTLIELLPTAEILAKGNKINNANGEEVCEEVECEESGCSMEKPCKTCRDNLTKLYV